MSELINRKNTSGDFRWQLLTTVSALALCGTLHTVDVAKADEADRPTVWIELGGQLERVQSKQDLFAPPFLQSQPRPGFETIAPASAQRPARYAFGGEAKVIVAPKGSDWSFLADVRFGRSNGAKHLHQQRSEARQSGLTGYGKPFYLRTTAFADSQAANSERHTIVDFMVGRDVGLGFGRNATATFDFGVRFAQFTSRNTATLRESPDPFKARVPLPPTSFRPDIHKYNHYTHYHSFFGSEHITRSSTVVGPSLSLNGSSPVMGNVDDLEIAVDWGANAAVLFGRQKVRGSYKTKMAYLTNNASAWGFKPKSTYHNSAPVGRSRSVIVPNVGGFAGLTFRRADAKVSFGYRADFFFGAMDGGIATRDTSNVGFFGPFAHISIGFGG